MAPRTLLLASLVFACGGGSGAPTAGAAPTPAPATADAATKAAPAPAKADEPPTIPAHDPERMKELDASAQTISQPGSMSAKLGNSVTTFRLLPPGSNAAILNEGRGIARVMIGGSPKDGGRPFLRIVLEPLRLDNLQFPATFELTDPPTKGAPEVRVEYAFADDKVWLAQPGTKVTLEGFDGKRLRGRFEGRLAARSSVMGPPIDITDGRFDIELRLNVTAPGATAGTAPAQP